MPVVNTH